VRDDLLPGSRLFGEAAQCLLSPRAHALNDASFFLLAHHLNASITRSIAGRLRIHLVSCHRRHLEPAIHIFQPM